MHFSSLASAAALFQLTIAGYVLEDDYMTDFYGHFNFFTAEDPTNGFVKYVNESTAREMNLINASTTVPVEWGVDVSNQTPEGRPSIRLEGKNKYTTGLVVIDVQHMPFGCGTWPAFWMLGPDWPTGGEIDILEGVNEQSNNAMTLHTGPGCEVGSDHSMFAGEVETQNCDVKAEGQSNNAGCSIKHPSTGSYGAGLNEGGGGIYATEWTDEAISVWFFPRNEIPEDALGDSPNPSNWGKPAARFQGACDIPSTFKENQLIFTTTFCGDWAGGVWESGSCAQKAPTCNDWVRDNPEEFQNAHWTINALKVYQNKEGEPEPQPEPTGEPEPTPEPTNEPEPIPTSEILTPAPLPTGNETFSTIAPPAETPIETGSPIPDVTSLPGGEQPTPTDNIDLPPQTDAPEPIPTYGNGDGPMPGFSWPQPGDGDVPAPTPDVPVTDDATTLPPAEPPVATQAPDNGYGNPSIETVWETVYVTVEARRVAPTPVAKRARNVGQHRRRLMNMH